mmetsp:Transcript_12464/g.20939  ORF Transcript_12464/g.20939 Transcript_12464/m.20939 type:complete len:92 (-) Transcript_12464:74-349(-)
MLKVEFAKMAGIGTLPRSTSSEDITMAVHKRYESEAEGEGAEKQAKADGQMASVSIHQLIFSLIQIYYVKREIVHFNNHLKKIKKMPEIQP